MLLRTARGAASSFWLFFKTIQSSAPGIIINMDMSDLTFALCLCISFVLFLDAAIIKVVYWLKCAFRWALCLSQSLTLRSQ